ncbi:MAG: hypothetical protein QW407_01525 [Thermofilaceae archaeon]
MKASPLTRQSAHRLSCSSLRIPLQPRGTESLSSGVAPKLVLLARSPQRQKVNLHTLRLSYCQWVAVAARELAAIAATFTY